MVIIFFVELILLFVFSRTLTKKVSLLFYIITKSRKAGVMLLAILFLPGTIIHEFSHAIIAEVLFVKARHMELFPVIEGNNVKLGSVQIQQTDFIRRFFIGVAPFILGTLLLLSLIWFVFLESFGNNILFLILIGYGIFTISNTMFSSSRDMEGAVQFLILMAILIVLAYLFGFHPEELGVDALSLFPELFKQAVLFLLIPLGIDVLIIGSTSLLLRR